MQYLRKLLALTALAIAAMALTAASASADTVRIWTGGTTGTPDGATYNGATSGTEVGTPTLTSGNSTVSCDQADTVGTIDGTNPPTADLRFSWATNTANPTTPGSCSVDTPIIDPVACDVDPIGTNSATATSVVSNIDAVGSGPNGRLLQAENSGTTVVCGTVFNCNATSTVTTTSATSTARTSVTATGTTTSNTVGGPDTVGVTAELNAATDTATIADTVQVTGLVGCSNPATWNAVYQVTPTNLATRP